MKKTFIIILSLCLSSTLLARENRDIEFVNEHFTNWGSVTDIHIQDTLLYVFTWRDGYDHTYMHVFDNSNPEEPQLLKGEIEIPYMRYIEMDGSLLCGSERYANGDSLQIVNISNLDGIEIVSKWAYEHLTMFKRYGEYIFVSKREEGEHTIEILDISNPAEPTLVTEFAGSQGGVLAEDMLIQGEFGEQGSVLFIKTWTRIYSFDISDDEVEELDNLQFDGSINGCALYDDIIYLGVYHNNQSKEMFTIDVSDPSEMSAQSAGRINGDGVDWIVVESPDRVYFSQHSIMTGNTVSLADFSDPTDYDIISSYLHLIEIDYFTQIENGRYVFSDYKHGLHSICVNDEDEIDKIYTRFSRVTFGNFHIEDDLLYTVGNVRDSKTTDLVIFDISDASNITEVSRTKVLDAEFDLRSFSCLDGMISLSNDDVGYALIDATNPEEPEVALTREMNDVEDTYLFETSLFLAEYEAGMGIYDITDPTDPQLMGRFDEDIRYVTQVFYANHRYAFLMARQDEGLQTLIVDYQDLDDIQSVNELSYGRNLQVDGEYCYKSNNSLAVYNISDMDDIQYVSGTSQPWTNEFWVEDEIVYAIEPGGVHVADHREQESPVISGYYLYDAYHAIQYYNGYIFTLTINGILVLDPSVAKGVNDPVAQKPSKFTLLQAYPNPFNNSTMIQYNLPLAGDVKLNIFDSAGRSLGEIYSGNSQAGVQSHRWDASLYPAGNYFISLQEKDNIIGTTRLTLIK